MDSKDFDGDAMAAMLMIDNEMAEMARNMAPHRNILNPNEPRQINNNPSMANTVVSNTTNWFAYKDSTAVNSNMDKFLVR